MLSDVKKTKIIKRTSNYNFAMYTRQAQYIH